MMRVMILDDEKKEREYTISILKEQFPDLSIDSSASIKELDRKRDEQSYDLYLLDIEVGKDNGLDYGIRIRDTDRKAGIIFITSHDEFALQGYEAKPLGYLTKPVQQERLIRLVREAKETFEKIPVVKIIDHYKTLYIKRNEIYAAERKYKKTIIYVEEDTYEVNTSIKKLKEEWGTLFIQISRSVLINSIYVRETDARTKTIALTNGMLFDFSIRGYRDFNKAYALSKVD